MASLRGLSRTAATMVVVGVLVPACGGEVAPGPASPEPPPTEPPPGGGQSSKDSDGAKTGGEDRSEGGDRRSDPGGADSGGSGRSGDSGGSGRSGGSEEAGGSFDPERPDAEGNDVPPPPGSPAERFERTCERNPRECY